MLPLMQRTVRSIRRAGCRPQRNGEGGEYARDRRVDPRQQHRIPEQRESEDVKVEAAHTQTVHHEHRSEQRDRRKERRHIDARRVDKRDDGNGAHVIDPFRPRSRFLPSLVRLSGNPIEGAF